MKNNLKFDIQAPMDCALQRGFEMRKVDVGKIYSLDDYEQMRTIWKASETMAIEIDPAMSSQRSHWLIEFLLAHLGDDFAEHVLPGVVELEAVSDQGVLAKVMDAGNKAARVSVCLKNALSDDLIRRCLADDDADVRSHALQRKAN